MVGVMMIMVAIILALKSMMTGVWTGMTMVVVAVGLTTTGTKAAAFRPNIAASTMW